MSSSPFAEAGCLLLSCLDDVVVVYYELLCNPALRCVRGSTDEGAGWYRDRFLIVYLEIPAANVGWKDIKDQQASHPYKKYKSPQPRPVWHSVQQQQPSFMQD